ncbi:MAG: DUF3256 family protein [Dysgonamonadaceae bacterium]|nr:DUF3256 family protein [Dysgonamonadaceae bacterium]MDD3355726.1 DUF3256 family protein [Dysgonamonadaceae bacterium]MDD3727022.1 DUF3256 family protein [Dysgonamonadaceae bacterium]MDD4245628.1 DUF3256 family protein [Dysgonamonadaceae bacterium]MDD4604775.1 DUF3256 family protein [Dysgonamonadaceae bacterium]
MKRYILFFFCCITFFSYGQTIDTVFKTMPDEFLPAFSEANKTMLLMDTSLSVIPYPLGKIERLEYTDTFLSLKTSDVGTLQMKLLPLVNNTQIISVVKTICSKKVCDSEIRFFSDKWEEIDKNRLMPDIQPEIFFDASKLNTLDFKVAASHINIYPLHFQFNKENDDLSIKFDFTGFLSSEDLKKIEPFVEKENLILSWNKSMFVFN